MIELTKTTQQDLSELFIFQTNTDGIWMAAFTPDDPNNRAAYMEKWIKIVENPDIRMQTIRLENKIIGSVAHFEMMEATHISYWIDQKYWGQGIATEAVKMFIKDSVTRPLFARVAFDNYRSQKVLEKSGFLLVDKDQGFANARKKEIEEFVYKFE
jgi:RimJ/RimL family protein N-acetyltransferase